MLTAAGVAAAAAGITNKADSQIIDDEIVSRCFIFSSRSIIRNIEDVFCLNFFIFIAEKKAVLRTVIFFCL